MRFGTDEIGTDGSVYLRFVNATHINHKRDYVLPKFVLQCDLYSR